MYRKHRTKYPIAAYTLFTGKLTQAMSSHQDRLMVAAIDFGTTYSGYAFSMRHELAGGNPHFHTVNWNAPTAGLVSFKAPTTVLLDENKKLIAFGYDAEEQYADMADEGNHGSYYYFRRFKMMLYDKIRQMKLTLKTTVADIRNKELPAVEVFTHAIRYMKDHLLDTLREKGFPLDIQWVLTVPAIWDDPAKQFMRKAAAEAGIDEDRLIIALEPEAASIYCKHIPVEKMEDKGNKVGVFKAGSKYLVLDAGGGTIDITVHEVTEDGNLKELDKASGGDWGGIGVDATFKKALMDIVGDCFMEIYCKTFTADYIELFRDFELKKRKLVDPITIQIPPTFIQESKKINGDIVDATQRSKYKKSFRWERDKLRVELTAFESFFEPSCHGIINHIKDLVKSPKVKDVNTILMVGGFSESPVLQNAVRQSFPSFRIIIPQEAGLSVLRGAVLFGKDPEIVKSRVAKFTYGVNTNRRFDPKIHKQSKAIDVEGEKYCSDLFSRHVKKGDTLVINEAQREKSYNPLRQKQKGVGFSLYTSTTEDPKYVDDPGCKYIGHLHVDLQGTEGELSREVKVKLIFGGTELKVEAMNERTKEKTNAEFRLLEPE